MLSLNFSLGQNDYYAFNLAFQKERLKESPRKNMLGLMLPIGLLIMLLVMYWSILGIDAISVLTTSIPFIILLIYTLIRLIYYFGKNSRVNPIVALLIKQQVSKFYKNPDNADNFESKEYTLSDNGITVTSSASQSHFQWEGIKKLVKTEGYIFLFTGSSQALIFPADKIKRFFELESFLSSHVSFHAEIGRNIEV